MQKLLIVAENMNQLKNIYSWLAESISPIMTKYHISDRDAFIITPNYKIYFRLEQNTSCGMRVDKYIYFGNNKGYEQEVLVPMLKGNRIGK